MFSSALTIRRPPVTIIGLLSMLLLAGALFLSPTPTQAQKQPGYQGPFALTNAQIITAPGDTLSNGTVVIHDDSIAAVGAAVTAPDDA